MNQKNRRLRTNDRFVKYEISSAFDYVLDISNPRLSRAVKFYELQTAILIGKKLHACQRPSKEHPDNWIRVSRSALSTARMVCRIRMLEHVITDKFPDVGGQALLKKLVRDKEATQLLRQIITSKKSKQLAYSLSWRELNRLLVDTRNGQKTYAALYDISLHFALHGGCDWKCIWTRAEGILKYNRNEPEYEFIRKHYKYLKSTSTAYKYKVKGDHFAVFIWLDHFGGGYLRPTQPIARSFVIKLLAKVDDTSALRTYLAQYAYVQANLERQDYDLAELRLTAAIPPQEVSFKPLPKDLAVLI